MATSKKSVAKKRVANPKAEKPSQTTFMLIILFALLSTAFLIMAYFRY